MNHSKIDCSLIVMFFTILIVMFTLCLLIVFFVYYVVCVFTTVAVKRPQVYILSLV